MNLLIIEKVAEIGGVAVHNSTLINGLKKRGHTIFFITGKGAMHSEYKRQGIEFTVLYPKFWFDPVYMYKIFRIIKENNIDILYVNKLITSINSMPAAKLARIPVVVNLHSVLNEWPVPALKKRLNQFFFRVFAHTFATRIIAINKNIKKRMTLEDRIRPELIDVIYNGIDFGDLLRNNEPIVRKLYHIPEDKILIGNLGRVSREKGLINLIKAAPLVLQSIPNAFFFIGGGGSIEDELRQEIKKRGLEQYMMISGEIHPNERARYFASYDLFVFPSLQEGFGLTLAEALGFGLPSVTFDYEVIKEFVTDGETAYLARAGDIQSLADAIVRCIQDPNQRVVAKRAQKKILDMLSTDTFVNEYEKLFRRLIRLKS